MAGPKIYETSKICERTLLTMEENTVIGDFNFISPASLTMLEGAQTNRFVEISGRGNVTIGRNATIASHCSLLTSSDTPFGYMNDQKPEEVRHVKTGDIIIGDNAFIGQGAVILPGVTVGEGAVIGAYSFVTFDPRPWQIMHPAKPQMISVFRMVDVEMPNYPIEELKKAKERIWNKER